MNTKTRTTLNILVLTTRRWGATRNHGRAKHFKYLPKLIQESNDTQLLTSWQLTEQWIRSSAAEKKSQKTEAKKAIIWIFQGYLTATAILNHVSILLICKLLWIYSTRVKPVDITLLSKFNIPLLECRSMSSGSLYIFFNFPQPFLPYVIVKRK